MKIKITILLASLCLTCFTSPASAAIVSSSQQASTSQFNYADVLYDYAVYAGVPRYRWFIVWEFSDGSTYQEGQFSTEQGALDYIAWLYFGGYEPEGAIGYDLVLLEVEPIMEHIATYDKKADALALANSLENIGLYTDIKRIGLYTFSIRR